MATSQGSYTQNKGGAMQPGGSGRGPQATGSAIDDITFNVLTVLQQKCEGLEACQKYIRDAQSNSEVRQLFEQVRQQDMQHVQQLRDCLMRLLGGSTEMGKMPGGEPTMTGASAPGPRH